MFNYLHSVLASSGFLFWEGVTVTIAQSAACMSLHASNTFLRNEAEERHMVYKPHHVPSLFLSQQIKLLLKQ
jgi:hypothetical protein